MRMTIPVFFERPEKSPVFQVRPLLFPAPSAEGKVLNRALDRLARTVRNELPKLPAQTIALRCAYPPIETQRLNLQIQRRKGVFKGRFFVVTFPSGQLGRVAFLPAFNPWSKAALQYANWPTKLRHGLWFLIKRGQQLKHRVTEVLSTIFRSYELEPEHFVMDGWTDIIAMQVNVDIPSNLKIKKKDQSLAALIMGGSDKFSGEEELPKTSTNLSKLYPNQLQRCFHRQREIEDAESLLWSKQRRSFLVLGQSGVGKSALIHELAYRKESNRKIKGQGRGFREFHILNPRLVIAGMSYVGQWQKRFIAILNTIVKRDHVLCITDLLDLFAVGQSRSSNVSMVSVLKPYLQRERIRFIAEASPEELRILKEKDRAFADLCQQIQLQPTDSEATLSISIRAIRSMEREQNCEVRPESMARVLELQKRFVRRRVFPGKAVSFLDRLTRRFQNHDNITADHVTQLFAEWSGLSRGFLDDKRRLTREAIVQSLAKRVIGQNEALNAIAETVLTTRAGLNNPNKPLGTFLFIGPTGVGKTEAAKAAASYLYGSQERLLRFDMNEYPDAFSVARLLGSGDRDNPEGLLTRRVRLRPFSVILFDEIEKAHPSVYDLLLQVLDEGHITDASGRMADFSNTIIILTSNLGVQRARGTSAMTDDKAFIRGVYREEVDRFFRPEFVNRLDRIIPFDHLKREQIRKIARLVVEDVLGREGLRRRQVVLNLDAHILERVIELGTDEDLGARPLKRAVSKLIMEPLSLQLAATTPNQTSIAWLRSPGDQIEVTLQVLDEASPQELPESETSFEDEEELARLIQDGLEALNSRIKTPKGQGRVIDLSNIDSGAKVRYRLQEDVSELLEQIQTFTFHQATGRQLRFRGSGSASRVRVTSKDKIRRSDWAGPIPSDLPDDDLDDYLIDRETLMIRSLPLLSVRRYAAALTRLLPALECQSDDHCLLTFQSLAPLRGKLELQLFTDAYREYLRLMGFECRLLPIKKQNIELRPEWVLGVLEVRGPRLDAILATELGLHLVHPHGEGPVPIAVAQFQSLNDFIEHVRAGSEATRNGKVLRTYRVKKDDSERDDGTFADGRELEERSVENKDASPFSQGMKRQSKRPGHLKRVNIRYQVTDHRSQRERSLELPLKELLSFVELLHQNAPLLTEESES